MELLLWRWSTTAQITSALMIALFFFVLSRSVRRVELTPWLIAFVANLGALAVTSVFWLARPSSPLVFGLLRWGYFFAKTLFVVALAIGASAFIRGRITRVTRRVLLIVAVVTAIATLLFPSISLLGLVQSAAIALVLGGGALLLIARRSGGSEWLAFGFSVRAVLAIVETFAYATRVVPNRWSAEKIIDIFLASHSSFDTGAEWAIALGCLLMLHRVIQHELTQSNEDLLAAKEALQELVDHDPLTNLANRRALATIFEQTHDAAIFFFDLNDFKGINDSYGHHAGDECLKRFARALESSFRPEDHVVRYAGDEFVVIAPNATPESLMNRIEVLRERLRFERAGRPDIRFAVGWSRCERGTDVEAAIRAADASMYRDKATAIARAQ
ncbi:MAG TPA: GGDEF domain-containing protein [Thermoanaerobaculia bacterium]|nr:GGDEF domain-containing protein [Thermoanaerobaculia bacterium]